MKNKLLTEVLKKCKNKLFTLKIELTESTTFSLECVVSSVRCSCLRTCCRWPCSWGRARLGLWIVRSGEMAHMPFQMSLFIVSNRFRLLGLVLLDGL